MVSAVVSSSIAIEIRALMEECWSHDAARRPTMQRVHTALAGLAAGAGWVDARAGGEGESCAVVVTYVIAIVV